MKKILTIIPFFLAAMTLSFASEGKSEITSTISDTITDEAYVEDNDASVEEACEKLVEKQADLENDSTASNEKPIISLKECEKLLDYTVEIKI
jgi:hypothetical protein